MPFFAFSQMLCDPAKVMMIATYEDDDTDKEGKGGGGRTPEFDSMPLFKL